MSATKQPVEIIVIGAGIVGASIAFHLAERGARVTVLEAGEPAEGASGVSLAWINAREKYPRAYHDLNRRSLDMWERFARRLGGDIGLRWGGELRWTATTEGARVLIDRVATLQSWGYPIHLLDPEELQRLEPRIRPGEVSAASLSPADGHVDAPRAIRACLAGATARGARVAAETLANGFAVTHSTPGTATIEAVQAGTGVFQCDAVVLAAGPDSTGLARLAGLELPLHHSFGATLVTEPVQPLLRTAALAHTAPEVEPQIALRQFEDGSVMIHGGEGGTAGASLGQTEEEVELVLAAAARYFPTLAGVRLVEVRKGRRPLPGDGHPILGFTEQVPNLYIAATHSGVTLAPLIGELAALEILHSARVDLLEPYRLERF